MSTTRGRTVQRANQPVRRLGVAEAKARLAEVLRDAEAGPTIIHNRGRDVAVVLSMAEYDALRQGAATRGSSGQRLVEALADWRERYTGVDFDPERIRIAPRDFRATSMALA